MSEIKLSKNFYQLRLLKVEDATSQKSGAPMKKLTFEITNAAPVMVDNRPVDINGHITFTDFAVLTEKALPFVNARIGAFDQAPFATIDDACSYNWQNLVGQIVYALCYTATEPQNDEAGNPIINPVTGKQYTRNTHKLGEFANKYEARMNQ